jgi:hypothetical protein
MRYSSCDTLLSLYIISLIHKANGWRAIRGHERVVLAFRLEVETLSLLVSPSYFSCSRPSCRFLHGDAIFRNILDIGDLSPDGMSER